MLHYTRLDHQPPAKRHSFLIDAGAEYLGYAADLTRSYAAQSSSLYARMVEAMNAEELALIATLKAGVRVNGTFYNAGMSIAVLAENGRPVTTRVGFNANQFVLMSGSDDTQYSPFAVVNGQVFISDAFIQDGSINNAKIGNYIQSNNYVPGAVGWRWDKNGNFENNGTGSGGRMTQSNNSIRLYDSNGILRVAIGEY